jgi:hypothetical protein
LFLVPKRRPVSFESAELSVETNGVTVNKIESTLGLRGLPLCDLSFQNSEGFLLGDDIDQATEAIATLSLYSRLHGAISGVAVAEKAFQASLKHSQQRRANRSRLSIHTLAPHCVTVRAIVRSPKILLPADPIIVHPDVRRMLLIQKAIAEGGRSMLLEHAIKIDQVTPLLALPPSPSHSCSQMELARRADKRSEHAKLKQEVFLMTPILKGFLTEAANEAASHCVQIHGGRGCLRHYGAEQLLRDSRQYAIHYGTTGLQGYELLTQRLLQRPDHFTVPIQDHCALLLRAYSDIRHHKAYSDQAAPVDAAVPSVLAHLAVLRQRVKEWVELSHRLSDRAAYHPHTLGIAAVDYLMYCGYLTLADHWLHMEHISFTLLQDKDYLSSHPERREFLETKLQVTLFLHLPLCCDHTPPLFLSFVDCTVRVRVFAAPDPGTQGVHVRLLSECHEHL